MNNLMDKHIFPFLWVHGEEHYLIEKEILAIKECGIDMFCVESRPHPNFCEDKWWDDFSFILETAKKLNMKVWLLDDKHFPTGYAVGSIEKHPELKQKNIRMFFVDYYSDEKSNKFLITDNNLDKFIGAFVFDRKDDGIDFESGIEVSDKVKENVLSLPKQSKGFKRVVALFETTRFPELTGYIDMLNPESADLQLKSVYIPHYEHFKDYFGKTFIGFFSDEPRFSNGRSEDAWVMKSMYQTQIGQIGVCYPWRDDILQLLEIKDKRLLVGLWFDIGKENINFKIAYMDLITNLYKTNFSERLGNWCKDHGVLYTGHITEDMGNHCRLGSGAGHYFRSMAGQDLAGIDVVLHQIESGFSHMKHIYPCPELYDNPDFFHFTLAKLATSAAHLEQRKMNNSMCEIFGAYGWGETISQMKWLVDFMLVRGINFFVPHAFNPKFNDEDCPPYFYYGGKNPMFSAFKELMRYTENMCSILSGKYSVDIGVLYHAEAEWSGEKYQPIDAVCRELMENQIDFDIVPIEYLLKSQIKYLIVPKVDTISDKVKNVLNNFKGEILYLKSDSLESFLLKINRDYYLKDKNSDIRILKRNNKYFVFNEGNNVVNNTLITKENGNIPFSLLSGQSILIDENYKYTSYNNVLTLNDKCNISLFDCDNNLINNFVGSYLEDINSIEGYESFCGKIAYELKFTLDKKIDKFSINFGDLSGGLAVTINDKEYNELFGVPYVISDSAILRKGVNVLRFTLSTTLALSKKDMFSKYCKIDNACLNSLITILY